MKAPHYLMQFFKYAHLPENMQAISKLFYDLAKKLDDDLLPDCENGNPEKTMALRKLLEAKDCAVRSLIYK